MRFSDVREAVKAYRAMGFRVVPLWGVVGGRCACGQPRCKERDAGKHEPPATDGAWKDGAEYGPEAFSADSNVALAMGPWRGTGWLVALDVDGPLLDLRELGPLPPTMTQRSPRGRHLVFEVPAYTPLGNWIDVLGTKASRGASLDLRYARGRIVAAPSRNAFGAYEWTDSRAPARLPQGAIDAILRIRRQRGLPVEREWRRDGKRP